MCLQWKFSPFISYVCIKIQFTYDQEIVILWHLLSIESIEIDWVGHCFAADVFAVGLVLFEMFATINPDSFHATPYQSS